MAHYAFIDENNIVFEVITGRDEDEVVDGISDWETYYGELRGALCKRTSYNTRAGVHKYGGTPFRLNYGSIGCVYDPDRDVFIENPPEGYRSWVLNEELGIYEAPFPAPDDSGDWIWDEDSLQWYHKSEWLNFDE
jgi:hypothetical protein